MNNLSSLYCQVNNMDQQIKKLIQHGMTGMTGATGCTGMAGLTIIGDTGAT